jgi:predicted nucleotidyltransferase
MLETVAKDFVRERFGKRDGVVGVLLVGSAALGYVDNLSDIDLEVVTTDKLYREVEACPEVSAQYRGIDVSWEWMTFKEFACQLTNWEDDIDLWIYSKSKILLDNKNTLRNFLHKYKHYPKKIWLDKLFHYWFFATGNAPYDSGKAIQRGDLTTAQLYLNQAIEYYTALIFILNNKFVPYRKWRLKELEHLAYLPVDFKENLHAILTVRNWTEEEFKVKQEIINELARSLEKELAKAGISTEKLQNPWKFKVPYVPRT